MLISIQRWCKDMINGMIVYYNNEGRYKIVCCQDCGMLHTISY